MRIKTAIIIIKNTIQPQPVKQLRFQPDRLLVSSSIGGSFISTLSIIFLLIIFDIISDFGIFLNV